MSVSARNQLSGTVASVTEGAVNSEVVLTLESGETLTTVITRNSVATLGLVPGKPALALIKAPWVILASADCGLNFSARNQFSGTVNRIVDGAVNATVHITTTKGLKLTASVTNDSVQEMGLYAGSAVIALVKASSVILATRA
ncbi:TOBE domain-containing protein [Dickeya zeae]|jgi:molybdate transport system regulatory protein|uniref:TOBE domain-containing protein n=1 Tax=Dickeya zeae TaxID=204042 RepID=UPI00039FCF43|nr:TOBE domain-containing protein [Dickeya zeae]PXW46891.1 molybdate transport system regulatory protein [Erwinia sp. AG740]AUQ24177.1 transporter [Dickeya zeae]MCA6988069.1 TOBE domain-containing protein [Dickeya zeae]UJR57290.1 TOBE domain-containing protein [Dickeya zeae]UJR63054.1 TOBE domain-containing protein [Dickeya zeae]